LAFSTCAHTTQIIDQIALAVCYVVRVIAYGWTTACAASSGDKRRTTFSSAVALALATLALADEAASSAFALMADMLLRL